MKYSAWVNHNDKTCKYYLCSKMIVPFLEFDIFWEKFVYFLVPKIALSQENVPFTKKIDQKFCRNWKSKQTFSTLWQKINSQKNIFLPKLTLVLFLPWLVSKKLQISPWRRGRRATSHTPLKSWVLKWFFGWIKFLKSLFDFKCEAMGLSFSNGCSTWNLC